jgi:hypothetical protein
MVVSEIEVETPEEWLAVIIDLSEKVNLMKMSNLWRIESGMTKDGWYVKVIIDDEKED